MYRPAIFKTGPASSLLICLRAEIGVVQRAGQPGDVLARFLGIDVAQHAGGLASQTLEQANGGEECTPAAGTIEGGEAGPERAPDRGICPELQSSEVPAGVLNPDDNHTFFLNSINREVRVAAQYQFACAHLPARPAVRRVLG